MKKLLADTPIAPNGGFQGITGTGPLANPGTNAVSLFSNLISATIGLMTIIAIIWFAFTFITGAIGIMSAGADKQALESSKKRIANGITGLVAIVSAVAIISLIGYLLGFNSILDLNAMFGLLKI